MWPRIDGVRLIIDQELVAMEAIEEHWIYKKRLRSKFRKNELKICFIVAAIWFIFQNHLPTYSWISMVLPVVLGEFTYRALSLERKWDEAFFERLDMSALVEDDSIRELKKIHAMLHAKLNRVLVVSHEPLLSTSIENFFSGSKNKYYLNAIEEYTTSAFFNVSFKCKKWYEIDKSESKINFFVKPKDL